MYFVIPGYEPVIQGWQWLYLAILGLAALLVTLPLSSQRGAPRWLKIVAGMQILLWGAWPFNSVIILLYGVLLLSAPFTASFLAMLIGICMFTSTFYVTFVRR